MQDDIEGASQIDFAKIKLNYEEFRRLASNVNLSLNEKIGFPDEYRKGYQEAIFSDIMRKLACLEQRNRFILDIGPGCAEIPRLLIDLCARQGHTLVLVDSLEMLNQLPEAPNCKKIEGPFPQKLPDILRVNSTFDAVLCYSVLHHLYLDVNLFDVVDHLIGLLAPGGAALVGDIPNVSKRKRFFSSAAGVDFHRQFMKTSDDPIVNFNTPELGRIDDAVLSGLIQRSQAAGCNAYLLPQDPRLPFANRRDDLLLLKP